MRDLDSRTYYELLGVEPDATTEQIKEAYREIARIYHPDSNFYSDIVEDVAEEEDSDVFKAITSAYQILVSEEKRRAYDDSLPKNLDSWGEDEEAYRAAPEQHFHDGTSSETVVKTADMIPEEWKREREYFEAHYEEILRPAPKADLVGASAEPKTEESGEPDKEGVYGDWEEPKPFVAGSRFGDLLVDGENKVPFMTAPTRRAVRHNWGMSLDPMTAILYIGIPALLAIVLVEIYLFM